MCKLHLINLFFEKNKLLTLKYISTRWEGLNGKLV